VASGERPSLLRFSVLRLMDQPCGPGRASQDATASVMG
jgi:hypothetical protein